MNRRALLRSVAAAALVAAACGDGGGGGTPVADLAAAPDLAGTAGLPDLAEASDLAKASDLAAAPDLAGAPADLAMPAAYPAGPYGAKVGNTFPKLAWIGYRNDAGDAISTTKPYGAYGADEMFRSGRRYALVHISEVF